MFGNLSKKRHIRKYGRALPHDLQWHYGVREYYTTGQVDAALLRQRLRRYRRRSDSDNVPDDYYAYAMYCSPGDFNAVREEEGLNCDYGSLRCEISDLLFDGDPDFSFSSLVSATTSSVSDFFEGWGSGDDGGSDSDGDAGNGD